MLALALVTLPVVAVLNGWIASERWPIQRCACTGDYQRVSDQQTARAVLPHAGGLLRGAIWIEVQARGRRPCPGWSARSAQALAGRAGGRHQRARRTRAGARTDCCPSTASCSPPKGVQLQGLPLARRPGHAGGRSRGILQRGARACSGTGRRVAALRMDGARQLVDDVSATAPKWCSGARSEQAPARLRTTAAATAGRARAALRARPALHQRLRRELGRAAKAPAAAPVTEPARTRAAIHSRANPRRCNPFAPHGRNA
jgi:hypothetical protein